MNRQNKQEHGVRAVIFDLGGVILRTDDPEPRRLLAAKYGKTYLELDSIVFSNPVSRLAEQGQATPDQVWAEVGNILQIPNEDIAKFRQDFFAGDQVDPELIQWIAKLHEKYQTALLSNTWVVDLDQYLRDVLHIPLVFDVIISSARSGEVKPGAAIFQLTLQALGIQADEAIFVDDNADNIQAAGQLGLIAIRFVHSQQLKKELSAWVQISENQAEA